MKSHTSKDHKNSDFYGMLHPASSDEKHLGCYKLVTDNRTYYLQAPEALIPYLKRHVWESFCVHGELVGSNKILVKRAQMQDVESSEPSEVDQLQDVELYNHQIHQGQTIESRDSDGV